MVNYLIKDCLDLLLDFVDQLLRVFMCLRYSLLNLKFENLNVEEVRGVDTLVLRNQLFYLFAEIGLEKFHL